jgi:hypothetical protein
MHAYCQSRGYHLKLYRGRFHLDLDRDPSLLTYGDRLKITLYEELYDDYDLVVWMDVDVLITNPDVTFESIIGERPFLWTYGPNGPLSGFTMARTIPEVHCFLHMVKHRAAEDYGMFGGGGRSDQDTMRYLGQWPPFKAVAENLVSCKEAGHCMPVEPFGWERYRYLVEWEPGDFMFTVPSLPLGERLEMLKAKMQAVYA